MKKYMDENFLLSNKASQRLYFDYAESLPIIDYHSHLPPNEIAEDLQYDNLTHVWLRGDHYKWRAMRTFGINEAYITGDKPDKDKFLKWAETVPNTLRNPLYDWTHLELKRYFGIDDLLSSKNAEAVYENAGEQLKTGSHTARGLMKQMKVEISCTTDDPIDDLAYHKKIRESGFEIRVLPTFRPDKAMTVEASTYLDYLKKLSAASGVDITDYDAFKAAIQKRHDFFHEMGGRLSDHGLNCIEHETCKAGEPEAVFQKVLGGKEISTREQRLLKFDMLLEFARMDHASGWTQQFHLGALRNNNKRLLTKLGPDTGFDSIGDFSQAEGMSVFFNTLDSTDQLAKTVIYNLNPSDNEVFATMTGNFNDGSVRGKMQFGSGWWFLDQIDGMEKQMNALSNMGLLSCFVGMLTDSRSFLSFPRHEYFRRLLCDLLGRDVEQGRLPEDYDLLGEMVANISYHNAKNYFKF
ncbi:MAG: glucuronate isomerase [Cyclobacteriaceae bacterium]